MGGALLHGDVVAAFGYNPLALLGLIAAGAAQGGRAAAVCASPKSTLGDKT